MLLQKQFIIIIFYIEFKSIWSFSHLFIVCASLRTYGDVNLAL